MLFFAVLLFHNLKLLNRFIETMLLLFLLTPFSQLAKSEYIVQLNIKCKKKVFEGFSLTFLQESCTNVWLPYDSKVTCFCLYTKSKLTADVYITALDCTHDLWRNFASANKNIL